MQKTITTYVTAILMLAALAGCAARQTVVLMPDRDGHVGQAEVSTAAGKQQLTQSGDMTQIKRASAAPSAVTTADPVYIDTTFGEALQAEPAAAEKFTLYFETGTATLLQDSQALLPSIVEAVQRRKAISIAVSGHTDATGSDQLNEQLSLARADKVKELLVQQGVDAQLIAVSSHGKGNPAVPAADGVAEPRNRRVEVIVQ